MRVQVGALLSDRACSNEMVVLPQAMNKTLLWRRSRSFCVNWGLPDDRSIGVGPPGTNDAWVASLSSRGVVVGAGPDGWRAVVRTEGFRG